MLRLLDNLCTVEPRRLTVMNHGSLMCRIVATLPLMIAQGETMFFHPAPQMPDCNKCAVEP